MSVDKITQDMAALKTASSFPAKLTKDKNVAGATPVTIATDMRKITVDKNLPIYKFDVKVTYFFQKTDGSEVAIEMSKSQRKGNDHVADKQRCKKVYHLFVQSNPAMRNGRFYYDLQSSLYSMTKIAKPIEQTITGEQVSLRPNFLRAVIKITPVAKSFQATTNEIDRTVNVNPSECDKTLLESLNMVINGPAYDNVNVITIGNGVHYLDLPREQLPVVLPHINAQGLKEPGVGTTNSVQTLEGPKGDPTLYMATGLKTSLFHPDGPLLDVLRSYRGFRNDLAANSQVGMLIGKAIKGLLVIPTHERGCEDTYKIRRLGLSSKDHTFEHNGSKTTVQNYYARKYNIRLQLPLLFVVEVFRQGKAVHYPPELLKVAPNQTVTNEQMVGNEQADMIKLSAARPNIRKSNTEAVSRSIGVVNTAIPGFTIGEPETVTGFVLPKPDIQWANNAKTNWSMQKGKIPTDFTVGGKYYKAATLNNWAVVFKDQEAFPEVINGLIATMRDLGMNVKPPKMMTIRNGNLRALFTEVHALAKEDATKKVELLFFVTRSQYNYHQEIKALEQEFDILTQDLRLETAQKMGVQTNTRQNIVHKINQKLGGTNFRVLGTAFNVPNRLFIGFETSQQGCGVDGVITVGFSANMSKEPVNFTGGYVYAKRGESDVYSSIIKQTIKDVLATCMKNNRGKPELVIYFSGDKCDVMLEYSDLVKKACTEFGEDKGIQGGFKPHITIIAAATTDNRFYKKTPREVVNLEPGTIIDSTIVSPVLNEWYSASAVARQGTCKTRKFTLLFTTQPNLSLTTLEKWTYELTWNHQIVLHPVSSPAPLYQAGQNAKRGSMILGVRKPVMDKETGQVDLVATNSLLGYQNKGLFQFRFNA